MRRKLYFAKVTLRCRYAIFDHSHVLSRGDSEEKMSVQFYILEEKMFVILCQDEKGTHTASRIACKSDRCNDPLRHDLRQRFAELRPHVDPDLVFSAQPG